jgi:hypothetical protein
MAGAVDDLAGSLASHIAVARTLEAQLKADHLPQSLEVFVSAFDQHLTGFQHHVQHVQRQLSQAISRSFSPKTRGTRASRNLLRSPASVSWIHRSYSTLR